MGYRVEFSQAAERDFEIIFEFLIESYLGFGEDVDTAFARAVSRIDGIREAAASIAIAPQRGTLHEELLPGLRHVMIDRAVFWFDVNDIAKTVRILAIFFGGQDHQRRMLARLLG